MKKLKVLSIIPARSGSKGLKNKNILKINGKTLIDYKIDLIKKSKIPSNTIILSTDSKKYAKMFERKVLVPFLRPEKLARDKTESLPVIEHAISFYEKKNIFFDCIILLEPPTPFTKSINLKTGFKKFIREKADVVASITETNISSKFVSSISKNLSLNKLFKNLNKFKKYQRQKFAKEYSMDGGFYIFKTEYIKKKKKLFSANARCFGIVVKKFEGLNIENIEDLNIARSYKNFLKK